MFNEAEKCLTKLIPYKANSDNLRSEYFESGSFRPTPFKLKVERSPNKEICVKLHMRT